MQVRWNYKLQPSQQQSDLMDEWRVTLRKHRNYSLREREDGWNNNNRDAEHKIVYAYGCYCELENQLEVGACCPLTCPVTKHGVICNVPLTKRTKQKLDKNTGEVIKSSQVEWDSASGIQSKRTTQLRKENQYFSRIDADVLQRNLAKLDAAYSSCWQHKRGFPAYRTAANFDSFEYKPGRVLFNVVVGKDSKAHSSRVYLPGVG
jgi:putative transposase